MNRAVRVVDFGGVEERSHLRGCHSARNVSRSMTTHSVRNDEESVLGCNTEAVFIVLSLESDVG